MSKHVFTDFEDSTENKSMWANSSLSSKHVGNFVADDGSIQHATIEFTPRVYHILDELIINVADQHIKHGVVDCHVTLANDGSVEITNNGQGFTVAYHEEAKAWDPFTLSAILNQGDKHDEIKCHLPTGGVNGIGLKICTRSCKWFEIHTVDANNRRYYTVRYEHKGHEWVVNRSQTQRLNSNMTNRENLPFHIIGENVIELASGPRSVMIGGRAVLLDATKPFTTIRYLPRYDYYGMTNPAGLFRAYKTRLYEIATYMNAPIYINGSVVPVKSLVDYMKLAEPKALSHIVELVDPEGLRGFERWPPEKRKSLFYGTVAPHYPLQVGVTVSTHTNATPRWACINGVIVTSGSCVALSHFQSQIEKHFASKVSGEFTSMVRGFISIYVVGPIPSPGWSGQSKFSFTLPTGFMKPYVLSDKMLDAIVASLKSVVAQQQQIEAIKEIRADMAKKPKVRAEKMLASPLSRLSVPWSKRKSVNLFLVEGESASKYVTKGMAAKDCCLRSEHVGLYIMTGVTMNARREFIEDNGQRLPTKRLLENIVWNEFMHMVGLKYGKTYETAAEQESLLVGKIVILTDQDVDGEGNLTTLIVNFIDTFFPALIRSGRIFRMATELIRVFDKDKCVAAFHNECDYQEWALTNHYYSLITNDIFTLVDTIRVRHPEVEADARAAAADPNRLTADRLGSAADVDRYVDICIRNFISRSNVPTKFTFEYYKGLASHNTNDCQQSFKQANFLKSIVRFTYDDNARKSFEDFFESDSEPRKIELRKGMRERVIPIGGDLSCTDLLRGPLVIYSLEDLRRKLSGQYDGLNDVKRRILYAALTSMVQGRVYKFDNLAGELSSAGHYHHGNNTLMVAMQNCGMTCFGSRRIPFFISGCDFGSRSNTDAGAPRYLKARLNHEGLTHLYPKRDIDILPHRVEDGEVSVVTYFCSTIPPIFETNVIPSHGWSIITHAMSIPSLITITRAMIDGIYDPAVHKLRYDTNGWRGRIITVGTRTLTVGVFTLEGTTVVVSELPFLKNVVTYQRQLVGMATTNDPDRVDLKKEAVYDGATHPFIADWGENAIEVKDSNGIPLHPNEIHVRFKLRPDAIATLQKAKIDDIELPPALAMAHNMGLTTSLSQQLNYMDPQDRVVEFKKYTDIVDAWFPMRKALYVEHVERQIVILTLERAYLTEIERSIDENISAKLRNLPEAEALALIIAGGYFRFSSAIINNPSKYTTTSLCMYASGFLTIDAFSAAWDRRDPTIDVSNLTPDESDKISHAYLMRISYQDMLSNRREARKSRIAAIDRKLTELRAPDMWRTMWVADLDGLDDVAQKYLPTMWALPR